MKNFNDFIDLRVKPNIEKIVGGKIKKCTLINPHDLGFDLDYTFSSSTYEEDGSLVLTEEQLIESYLWSDIGSSFEEYNSVVTD